MNVYADSAGYYATFHRRGRVYYLCIEDSTGSYMEYEISDMFLTVSTEDGVGRVMNSQRGGLQHDHEETLPF